MSLGAADPLENGRHISYIGYAESPILRAIALEKTAFAC